MEQDSLESSEMRQVLTKVDEMQEEIISLTSELVRKQSVNPNYPGADTSVYLGGEKECNRFLEDIMSSFGCETDLFERAKDRTNLVGTLRGSGEKKEPRPRSLILTGHIDTVPFGNKGRWTDSNPISGKVIGGKIFGRGSCDMKGGIIAMIKATEAIIRAGYVLRGDLFIESVVGEETMDHLLGTSAAIDRGYQADAAIITEPNSLCLSPLTTGVILMTVAVKGKSTHATARDQMIREWGKGDEIGVNAIEKAVKVIQILQKLELQWATTKKHPLFNPGHFVIHPGVINGAPHEHRYVAVVPDECFIEYAILFSPKDSPQQVQKEIKEAILEGCGSDAWLSKNPPEISWNGVWPTSEISTEHDICRTIRSSNFSIFHSEMKIVGFPAPVDAPFLNQRGIPTVIFGPGDLPQAHAENEYVETQQLIDSTKILALTIMKWCGAERRS